MKEVMSKQALPEEPIEWVRQNLGLINVGIYTTWNNHIRIVDERFGYSTVSHFSPSARRFTEMPLCGSLREVGERVKKYPPGFSPAVSELTDITTNQKALHAYLLGFTNERRKVILCWMNAQMIEKHNENYPRGARVKALQERAEKAKRPDLYRIVGNLGVIYGYADEVEEYLGLKFG